MSRTFRCAYPVEIQSIDNNVSNVLRNGIISIMSDKDNETLTSISANLLNYYSFPTFTVYWCFTKLTDCNSRGQDVAGYSLVLFNETRKKSTISIFSVSEWNQTDSSPMVGFGSAYRIDDRYRDAR